MSPTVATTRAIRQESPNPSCRNSSCVAFRRKLSALANRSPRRVGAIRCVRGSVDGVGLSHVRFACTFSGYFQRFANVARWWCKPLYLGAVPGKIVGPFGNAVRGWQSRSYYAALVGVGYTLFAALQSTDGTGASWVALVVLPVLLALVWTKSAKPVRGIDPIDPAVRSAARMSATGAAMVAAAWTGTAGTATLGASASVGAAMASIGALFSLARVAAGPGLLQPPRATRRLDAAGLSLLLWTIAVVLPASRALFPEATTMLDPVAIDMATLAASAGSLGLLIMASARLRALRRLELGVADRAAAALVLSVVTLAVAVPASVLRVGPPDRVMMAAVVLASGCVQFSCISKEPTKVAQAMRTVVAIALLGAPVGLAGVALSLRSPQSTGLLMLAVGAGSVVVGLVAPRLARPLGPSRSQWLQAIEKANEAALHPDPDVALRDALVNVRSLLPPQSASPAIFQVSPEIMLTVDRAGYVQTREAQAPESLFSIAEAEPEATARADVLRVLQVRRPDLRPLVQWIDARGLLSVTLMRDEDGPVGLLAIPRAKRRAPMSLEEVRALRVLADRIGAVLGVSSALARSRTREMELHALVERQADEIERLRFSHDGHQAHVRASAERMAQPLARKVYSPASTMALHQAQNVGQTDTPITLLTPPGVDPVPWAAMAHLHSTRANAPLVVVWGIDPVEHDLSHWREAATSPLCYANTGTLMVVDVQALPEDVQTFIASSLSQRVCPGKSASTLDLRLAVSVCSTVDALVASERLTPPLADWLGDSAIAIPPLATRSEDLRAIVLDHLTKIGARLKHHPVGIDDAALQYLLEHTWPGNDIELADIVLRSALVAKGPRITVQDLAQIGFTAVMQGTNEGREKDKHAEVVGGLPKIRVRRGRRL